VHSGEIAGLFGIFNMAFGTCQEDLQREGTPDDTLDRLDLARIETQVDEIGRLLSPVAEERPGRAAATGDEGAEDAKDAFYAVADREGLSLKRGIVARHEYVVSGFQGNKVTGAMVVGGLRGSSLSDDKAMNGAIVQFRPSSVRSLAFDSNKPYAFDDFQVLRANRNGSYGLGPVAGGGNWWRAYTGVAVVFDERGEVARVSNLDSLKKLRERLNVFPCHPGVAILPPQMSPLKSPGDDVRVLSSRGNAVLDKTKALYETMDGVVYWYAYQREKGIKLFALRQAVGLNNGAEALEDRAAKASAGGEAGKPKTKEDEKKKEEEEAERVKGEGFLVEETREPMRLTRRSASDLWRLDEHRLQLLRDKDIIDSSVEELHGRAEDLLIAARNERSAVRSESLSASAFWASRPVYRKIHDLLDDLVHAVLILLALSVPFAFSLERVLVGAVTIYRQISWFVTFFVLTFVTLYFAHPAFAIAKTPIIIFLGFTILVMSVLVIAIIMRKFEVELKALQGMTTTVHAADVSRVNTLLAAMQMGVSTMRRRPLRTALTAVTIILLTFTILCFASFGTQSGIVTLSAAPNPAYSGVWLHKVNWEPLAPEFMDVLEGRWGDTAGMHRRFWICPRRETDPDILVTREDGSGHVALRGILGIEPAEVARRHDLGRIMESDLDAEGGKVLVTKSVARALSVAPGDTVVVRGRRLVVGKLTDAVELSAAKDMDGISILPVDFVEASSGQQTEAVSAEDLIAQPNWASLPVDSVAIVSAKTARELGAGLYGVMLYTKDTVEATATAEDMARMLPFPVVATRPEGAYYHVLGTVLAASGAGDLFFPILLGGLVIFGTMLGSVADREREIYTFSALGLAPRHVGWLFFAESAVYALLGGMGGYLLAQGTLKILTLFADYGLVTVPEMNVSSFNTIFTILIVMGTVLVSAAYPAIKASKSANPGLMRQWRPPEPKGNVLDLVFPFTVSEYDITGVVSFLKEHFDNHGDTGLGRFIASGARLGRGKRDTLGIEAKLSLAPFDLGVSQSFELSSIPSEIPGIDEVRIRIERVSGQQKDWQRLNKVFLDDLRQQFLLWRSLPHETMETYRQNTLAALATSGA
jgi:hypothetical protein